MNNFTYELVNMRTKNNIKMITCRVLHHNGTPQDRFDLFIDKNDLYYAWTSDTISIYRKETRKKIEKELNQKA